jgi:hypothetical protein
MKSVKRRPSSQTKAKQPGATRAVKRRATPPRKAKQKKPKTITHSSDSDSDSIDSGVDTDEDGDVKMSAKKTGVKGTLLWNKGGEMFFGKQIARIIAITDNHYPEFMCSKQDMQNGFKLAIHLSRTTKSTFHGVIDRNYMEVVPGLSAATSGEDEVTNQSPL